MVPRPNSPETPGDIQAKLLYLRNRRAVLDDLIGCLERYAVHELPVRVEPAKKPILHFKAAG